MSFYYPIPEIKKSPINYDCDKCGMGSNPKLETPYFPSIKGKNYNGLVILGQQPSKDDDLKQTPFINKKAIAVRAIAYRNGINLNNQAAFTYALQCHSGKKATDVQYKCCRSRLESELKELKPKIIICCGEMAFKSLFDLKNKIAATKLRGRLIPNFEFNCLVYTTFSPNDIHMFDQQFALKKDIKRALKFWSKYNTYTKIDELLKERKILDGISIEEIKSIKQLNQMIDYLLKIKSGVAFDFETTNLKPYDNNFEITYISFGIAKKAWVINESTWLSSSDFQWTLFEFISEWLQDPEYQKIIQNTKFEENCARFIFGIKKIVNVNDPMIASHVIDERRGCTSLDFQNLIRFGIPPYSDTVKSFLEKKNKDDKVNRIREAPYNDMITYGGLDVITTYHNWKFIESILPTIYPEAKANYEFLLRGHKLFSNMTKAGITIGQLELNEIEELLINKMNEVLTEISDLPEFIQYNNYLKDKTNLKNTTDQQLNILTKRLNIGVINNDNYVTKDDRRTDKPIRRKLSF